MTRTRIFGALALAAAACAAQAAPTMAALPSSVSLDGYCDGFTNVDQTKSAIVTATHSFSACGYSDTTTVGPVAMKMNGAKMGVALTDSLYPQFGLSAVYVLTDDHNWYLIDAVLGLLNSGTWSAGFDASKVQGGAPTSIGR